MSEVTPVVEPVTPPAVEVPVAPATPKQETPKPSPAQDLKEIQNLLVMGIFPGQMAPSVVKAYTLIEQMVNRIEQENKA